VWVEMIARIVAHLVSGQWEGDGQALELLICRQQAVPAGLALLAGFLAHVEALLEILRRGCTFGAEVTWGEETVVPLACHPAADRWAVLEDGDVETCDAVLRMPGGDVSDEYFMIVVVNLRMRIEWAESLTLSVGRGMLTRRRDQVHGAAAQIVEFLELAHVSDQTVALAMMAAW